MGPFSFTPGTRCGGTGMQSSLLAGECTGVQGQTKTYEALPGQTKQNKTSTKKERNWMGETLMYVEYASLYVV